jgi:hypothetical protein
MAVAAFDFAAYCAEADVLDEELNKDAEGRLAIWKSAP